MTENSKSILQSTKKLLSLDPDYKVFDLDIITFINTALATLTQVGVGPISGFAITSDEETWEDFFEDRPVDQMAKTFIYTKVRSLFDPPESSWAIEALNKTMDETLWRLNLDYEENNPKLRDDSE